MRVPLSWLRDFAPFEGDPVDLAATMDDLGLVVEEIEHTGRGLDDVVVARVTQISPIPGADRIRRVVVDRGSGEQVEVVCGAWNFAEDDLVALAPVGTVLPGGLEIKKAKMKGVVSNGMLCSGAELTLSDDHEGILVLGRFSGGSAVSGASPASGSSGGPLFSEGSEAPRPNDDVYAPKPGTALVEALGIEPDVVFDIAVDTNRPDAASMSGVARDLAARLHLPFEIPEPPPALGEVGSQVGEFVTLDVVDRDLCPRFTARVVTGVQVGPSPRWLARRLTLAGMRPINNVVDASNYVMLDLGQPTHPYDLDRVNGKGLRVRAARRGEEMVTLDGVTRRMAERSIGREDDERDCMICDAQDTAIGIAGIMGGADTEIAASTSRVLLEAAYFAPMAIARTSKRLGLRTEASSRFERGVDPSGIDRAAARFCELVSVSAPGAGMAQGVLDVRGDVPTPRRVRVRTERVNALLGSGLSPTEIVGYLEPIGFECDEEPSGDIAVTVPTFRPDTAREVDVIEEVGRHHGYSRLARRRIFPPQVGGLSRYQRERRVVREVMAGVGCDEAWTPSLLGPGDHQRAGLGPETGDASELRLANPLTPEESVLRRSLLPGMLKALEFNAARRRGDLRIFEVGHVFKGTSNERMETAFAHKDAGSSVLDEREMLGVLLADEVDDARSAVGIWNTLALAIDLVDVELVAGGDAGREHGPLPGGLHPTRTALVVAPRNLLIGVVGEVDPVVLARFGVDTAQRRAGWFEVDLGLLLGSVPRKPKLAAPLSRFPSSDIDLAFVVDESIPAAAVSSILEQAAGDLLESLSLFDVYRGPAVPEGKRSLAWRLRLCALDHTLTDEEIARLRGACIDAVERAHRAELRN